MSKSKHLLVVVDMQNDFCSQTGTLANKDTVAIVEKMADFLERTHKDYEMTVFTLDTHEKNYLETLEGINLPVEHCIKGSWGHALNHQINEVADKFSELSCRRIEKNTFGNIHWMYDLLDIIPIRKNNDDFAGEGYVIDIMGVCTDICVVSNALILRATYPDAVIRVIEDLSAGTTPEKHAEALDVMKSCQIKVIKSDAV